MPDRPEVDLASRWTNAGPAKVVTFAGAAVLIGWAAAYPASTPGPHVVGCTIYATWGLVVTGSDLAAILRRLAAGPVTGPLWPRLLAAGHLVAYLEKYRSAAFAAALAVPLGFLSASEGPVRFVWLAAFTPTLILLMWLIRFGVKRPSVLDDPERLGAR